MGRQNRNSHYTSNGRLPHPRAPRGYLLADTATLPRNHRTGLGGMFIAKHEHDGSTEQKLTSHIKRSVRDDCPIPVHRTASYLLRKQGYSRSANSAFSPIAPHNLTLSARLAGAVQQTEEPWPPHQSGRNANHVRSRHCYVAEKIPNCCWLNVDGRT